MVKKRTLHDAEDFFKNISNDGLSFIWREVRETQKCIKNLDGRINYLEGRFDEFYRFIRIILLYIILPLLFMVLVAVIYNILSVPYLPF